MNPYLYPAKIISYDKQSRTANVSIAGVTDGAPNGLIAHVAYPIGDDDRDTEREILSDADCWVFFEKGDMASPVVAFYRRHGVGAVVDVRRIRQANIELLARHHIKMNADSIEANADTVTINANLVVNGDITHKGDQFTNGNIAASKKISADDTVSAPDVIVGGKSQKLHTHNVLSKDYGVTGTQN